MTASHMPLQQKNERKDVFDVMRGFAIAFMVLANTTPAFGLDYPFWLRFLYSMPAPIFICLFGFMVACHSAEHPFIYYLKKGAFLIAIGTFVDICINNLAPFFGFDVFYLMGASIPLMFFAMRLNPRMHFILILIILAIAPILRAHYGYSENVTMIPVVGGNWAMSGASTNGVLHHWLYDGWFPAFPWLAFAFTGLLVGRFYVNKVFTSFYSKKALAVSGALLLIGLMLYRPDFHQATRYGYVEVFYPATTGFMLVTAGVLGLLMALFEFLEACGLIRFVLAQFSCMGRSALLIYIVHLYIIGHFIDLVVRPAQETWPVYIMTCTLLLSYVLAFAYGLKIVKKNYKKQIAPWAKWLMGG